MIWKLLRAQGVDDGLLQQERSDSNWSVGAQGRWSVRGPRD